jgi:hypothetical protein
MTPRRQNIYKRQKKAAYNHYRSNDIDNDMLLESLLCYCQDLLISRHRYYLLNILARCWLLKTPQQDYAFSPSSANAALGNTLVHGVKNMANKNLVAHLP